MTEQIKAALRGDPDAAAECTAAWVAIPCPFCGGEANIKNNSVLSETFDTQTLAVLDCETQEPDAFWVECEICKAMMGEENSDKEALAAWNRRVRMEEAAEPVKA